MFVYIGMYYVCICMIVFVHLCLCNSCNNLDSSWLWWTVFPYRVLTVTFYTKLKIDIKGCCIYICTYYIWESRWTLAGASKRFEGNLRNIIHLFFTNFIGYRIFLWSLGLFLVNFMIIACYKSSTGPIVIRLRLLSVA